MLKNEGARVTKSADEASELRGIAAASGWRVQHCDCCCEGFWTQDEWDEVCGACRERLRQIRDGERRCGE